jgi:hypothetical protein
MRFLQTANKPGGSADLLGQLFFLYLLEDWNSRHLICDKINGHGLWFILLNKI